MISLFKRLFIDNWLRKLISLALAIVIWLIVNQSITGQQTFTKVPVSIVNLPDGKTITHLQSNGYLTTPATIQLVGRKNVEQMTSNDLEIVIDASQLASDGSVNINKTHLRSLNPDLIINKHVKRVIMQKSISAQLIPLFTETIPVYVTPPIGNAPKGYQVLDIWPHNLTMTINGPEEVVKKYKAKGLKYTVNLNDVSVNHLEKSQQDGKKDVISYSLPETLKQLTIPEIANHPLQINDPAAQSLHIDFVRTRTLPVNFRIPIQIFIPPNCASDTQLQSLYLAQNEIVTQFKGFKILNVPVYVKGVSELFLKTVSNMLTLSLSISHKETENLMDVSCQCINATALENKYLSMVATEISEIEDVHPHLREMAIRQRFRKFMQNIQFVDEMGQPIRFKALHKGREVLLTIETVTP